MIRTSFSILASTFFMLSLHSAQKEFSDIESQLTTLHQEVTMTIGFHLCKQEAQLRNSLEKYKKLDASQLPVQKKALIRDQKTLLTYILQTIKELPQKEVAPRKMLLTKFTPEFLAQLEKINCGAARNKKDSFIPTLPPVIKKEIIRISDESPIANNLHDAKSILQNAVVQDLNSSENNKSQTTASKGWSLWPW